MLRPVRVAEPTEYPVSLDEARAHLRREEGEDDALIMALIEAATDHLDGYTGTLGRCIVTQQWRQDFASWSSLRLPFPNVSAVSVTYSDADGVTQTVDTADHRLIDAARGPEVYFRPGWNPPDLESGAYASVQVAFTAGFGPASRVPAAIKAAILLHVGSLYEHREDLVIGATTAPTGAYDALIAPLRWRS